MVVSLGVGCSLIIITGYIQQLRKGLVTQKFIVRFLFLLARAHQHREETGCENENMKCLDHWISKDIASCFSPEVILFPVLH